MNCIPGPANHFNEMIEYFLPEKLSSKEKHLLLLVVNLKKFILYSSILFFLIFYDSPIKLETCSCSCYYFCFL